MAVTSAVLGDLPMIVVTGALDVEMSDSLRAALDGLIQARHNVFFLDLTDVTSVDVGGLSAIRHGARALGQRGWIGLIGMNADVRRLLEIEGILAEPRIRMFEHVHAARIATGERAST